MNRGIVQKLATHLKRPIRNEASIVYLLSLVRKLLETENVQPKPITLWLYCNWALHIDLNFPETTKALLTRIDAFIMDNVSGFPGTGRQSLVESNNLFRDLVSFDDFRSQLNTFLEEQSLSTSLCLSDKRWQAFVASYIGVVEDGELSIKTKHKLTAVDKVVLRIENPQLRESPQQPFAMRWDVFLKDGRILQIQLEATSNLKFISHGANLIPPSVETVSS